MLGLDLRPNGGAALEAIARQGNPNAYPFNVPMKKYGNCDFSYAGLKTSVRLCIERELGSAEGAGKRASNSRSGGVEGAEQPQAVDSPQQQPDQQQQQDDAQQQQQIKADVAASFQRVAVAHLVMRLKRAIQWAQDEEPSLQHLVVAGGVASNQYVRQQVMQVRCCYAGAPILGFGV
jgi:N6-L-threonylcarbamoyladenine synthase